VSGVLPMAITARERGLTDFYVAGKNVDEALLIDGRRSGFQLDMRSRRSGDGLSRLWVADVARAVVAHAPIANIVLIVLIRDGDVTIIDVPLPLLVARIVDARQYRCDSHTVRVKFR